MTDCEREQLRDHEAAGTVARAAAILRGNGRPRMAEAIEAALLRRLAAGEPLVSLETMALEEKRAT